MSQLQLCTSPRESPIPAKTGFVDPVQDHMLFVIIDAIQNGSDGVNLVTTAEFIQCLRSSFVSLI